MLQVGADQLPRLQDLEANAIERLDEARQRTWLPSPGWKNHCATSERNAHKPRRSTNSSPTATVRPTNKWPQRVARFNPASNCARPLNEVRPVLHDVKKGSQCSKTRRVTMSSSTKQRCDFHNGLAYAIDQRDPNECPTEDQFDTFHIRTPVWVRGRTRVPRWVRGMTSSPDAPAGWQ